MRASVRRLGLMLIVLPACGGTCGGFSPVPGGFGADDRLDRGAQARLTRSGLDFLETAAVDLIAGFSPLACSATAPCPTGFTGPSGVVDTTCDASLQVCVDSASRTNVALFGGPSIAPRPAASIFVAMIPLTLRRGPAALGSDSRARAFRPKV